MAQSICRISRLTLGVPLSDQSTGQTTFAKGTITTLACRILALWVFTQAVTNLATVVIAIVALFGFAASGDKAATIIPTVITGVPSLILLAIAILLWVKADLIGSRMLPQTAEQIAICGPSSQEVLAIAFAALGMYVLVDALPKFGRQLAVAIWESHRFADAWNDTRWQIGFWANLFQIGIGIWLMLGMRGIARAVRSLQRSDVPKDESFPSDPEHQ